MTIISNPKVKLLEAGEAITIKQMGALAGQLLPRHKASVESALVVIKGACIVNFEDRNHSLSEGDSLVIPAKLWHQIEVKQDLRAIHIMPKGISFDFTE